LSAGFGFFESFTGHFENGMSVSDVSKKHARIMSIMNHLQLMFNTIEGTCHKVNYGLPPLPDTFIFLPSDTEKYSKILENAIYANEPRISKVSITGWRLNNKTCHLECCLVCKLQSDEIAKFRFIMARRHIVEPWIWE